MSFYCLSILVFPWPLFFSLSSSTSTNKSPNDDFFELFSAVMETDGFEYLKESCPSVLTELLQYVARIGEHSATTFGYGKVTLIDGSDVNRRRVKPRLY